MKIFLLIIGSFVIFGISGIMSGWLERKITARLQWRIGPPWWQNFADFLKLTGKETVVPDGANQFLFFLVPVIGVISVVITGAVLLSGIFYKPLRWDLFIFIYLMMIPSITIFLAGAASGNVLASVGAGRELRLLLSYELPFILALLVPVVKYNSAQISEIMNHQMMHKMNIGDISGFIAFIVGLLAFQGKIGYVPFDVSEAETEIAGGTFVEYSGLPLALFRLMKWILLSIGVTFFVIYFLGGFHNPVTGILKYLVVLLLIVLVKNTNPRLRTDQILRFSWGWLTMFGFFALILSLGGF
ncbi:MAG TPA: NADH-quinone oxidoreductase subunit H [bacterium]|nr:NADH-quinone oxidoreductase subunit H [bacterium]HPO51621.1 NADH-quinone oxidoreductase subunit H [bacterium]